ncbi:MAG: HEAT repeat domain-containing protein [Anaerolineales bacterium]|nr:HEAT repeat domain-containing protein [Anaerolineales bacterium]
MTQDLLAELASGDDARAENSIPAIVELGAAAIPLLLDLTRAPDADSRWWAVRALAASRHTLTAHLIPLLDDSAPEVRAATALALCAHPHEDAIPALIKTLADEDSIAAGLAATALTKIGKSAALSLIEVMKSAPINIRILALRALSEIGDHRAIPVLMQSMSEESAVLQYWAQIGLERLGLDMVYIKP